MSPTAEPTPRGHFEMTEPMTSRHRPANPALPAWYAHALAVVLTGTLAVTTSGLLLAMVGAYRPVPVGLLGAALWAGLAWLWFAGAPSGERTGGRVPREAQIVAVVVVVVAVVLAGFNARYSSQHLRTNRDPGSYNVIAASMVDEGDLLFETREGPFGDHPELDHTGFAFYDVRDDGRVYAQFNHGYPALLGAGQWLGDTWLLVRVNALLGGVALLAVYAFATRLLRPALAGVATLTLGLNFVQVWFSRDSFTEIPTQLLLFGALWVLWSARRHASVPRGLLAGLLLGGTALLRIDAYLYLAPLAVYLVVDWLQAARWRPRDRDRRRRFTLAVAAGALLLSAVGLLDLIVYSPEYLADREADVAGLGALLGAALVVGSAVVVLRDRLSSLGRALWARRRGLGSTAAVGVVVAGAIAWFVRPEIQTVTGNFNGLVAGLQERDALGVDGTRKYAEDTMRWMAWYLGPVTLGAGVAGLAVLSRRAIARGRVELLAFLGLFAAGAALYLWRPAITPDHPWAMRRFLPLAVPGFILMATVSAQWLWEHRGRLAAFARTGAVGVLVVGVAFATHVLWPLRTARAEVPNLDVMARICDEVEGDGAVVVLDEANLGNSLPQAIRGLCGVPTAVADPAVSPALIETLDREWEAAGRRLLLVHADPRPFEGPALLLDTDAVFKGTRDELEVTIERRPDRIITSEGQLYLSDVVAR